MYLYVYFQTESLELMADSLVALLKAQPALASLVPSLGHLPSLLKNLGQTNSNSVSIRCSLLLLHQLARNEVSYLTFLMDLSTGLS